MIRSLPTPRLLALVLGLLVTTGTLEAHVVSPTSLTLRPGGEDFFFVVDQGTCPATITATTNDASIVQVFAVDMNGGGLLSGNGVSASVPNRIDQVFLVRAQGQPLSAVSTTITVCWVGSTAPNPPCNEDNCPGGVPVSVTVEPHALTTGAALASSTALDPVNTNTGEFVFPEPLDLSLGGPLALGFGRFYASRLLGEGVGPGPLGPNWLHNFDWQLSRPGNNVEIRDNTGRVIRFERGYFGAAWSLASVLDIPYQLIDQGAGFLLADPTEDRTYAFDAGGRLTSIADRDANTLTLSYSGALLSSVGDGRGRTLTLTYGGSNELLSVSDGTRAVTYTYNGNGTLATVTDPASKTTSYAYDGAQPAAALLTARQRPEGNTPRTQTYDGSGRVLTQTDALGNPWAFSYGAQPGSTTVSDPLAGATTHTHGTDRELTGLEYPGGAAATLSNDSLGRRTGVTDTEGSTASWTWHAPSGKLQSITAPGGARTTFSFKTTSTGGLKFYDTSRVRRPDGTDVNYTFDAAGNVLTEVDPAGNTWTNTYDAGGLILTSTNPAGGTTTFTYNADGTLATILDPDNNLTSLGYDVLRRPILVTRPDATTQAFTYDALDRLLTDTNELGEVRTWTYDDNGNTTSYTTAAGETWTLAYDALDRVTGVTDPLGNGYTCTFDALGRLATVTNRVGGVRTFGYDVVGSLTDITDELGRTWSQAYDNEGELTSKSSPLALVQAFASDSLGRPTSQTSPLGHEVRYTYDARGRLTQVRNPLGATTSFSWSSNGLLRSTSMGAGGGTATYTHNVLGRMASASLPGGGTWSFAYDTLGRRTSASDPLGNTSTYQYDVRGLLDTLTQPGIAGVLDFEYDDAGRLTRRLYPDGTDLSFSYDAAGRLETTDQVTLAYDGAGRLTTSNRFAMTRDAAGRLETVTLAPGKVVTYAYDATGFVSSVTDWVGGQTTFGYDNDGRLLSILRPNASETLFEWDPDGRLARLHDEDPLDHGDLADHVLTRDALGQVTAAVRELPISGTPTISSQGWAFDAASQVTAFSYDGLGRLTADATRTYTWDDASRLVSYTEGGTTVSLDYDTFGLLRTRAAGGVTSRYIWNYAFTQASPGVVREGGQDVRYYVHMPDGMLLHSIEAADDARHFYHYDEAGSTVLLTDDAGVLANAYHYDAFGVLLAQVETQENPFTYHGAYGVMREGTSGLYYMRARYYDSVTSRFISRDPIQTLGPRAGNPYQFVYGNPLLYRDPSGMRGETVHKVPAAVTAYSSEQLENVGTLDIADLAGSTPNLSLNRTPLRGLTANPGQDDVLIIINGVKSALRVSDIDPALVSQIQVLRGPQAALYGRNHGGVLLITTKPTGKFTRTIEKFRAQKAAILASEQTSLEYAGYGDLSWNAGYGSAAVTDQLCLDGGRFSLQATWENPSTGGLGASSTDDSGLFWYFDPAATEDVLKALDGYGGAPRFWTFAGSMMNVELNLNVRDTQSWEVRAYLRPCSGAAPGITNSSASIKAP